MYFEYLQNRKQCIIQKLYVALIYAQPKENNSKQERAGPCPEVAYSLLEYMKNKQVNKYRL